MTAPTLALIAFASGALFALALAASWALSRSPAALRRLVLLCGFVAVLALPAVTFAFGSRPMAVAAPIATSRVVAEALPALDILGSAGARSSSVGTSSPRGAPAWSRYVVLAWLAGAAIALLRLVGGVAQSSRLLRHSRDAGQEGVRLSDDIDVPVVIGLASPKIVLPAGAASWSPDLTRSVLLHEGAHVRRRDGLALFVAQIACALHWFQPLAWLALARLRRECEFSADEDVLEAGVAASAYAGQLLAIARATHAPLGAIPMAQPSELGRRIDVLVSRSELPPRLGRQHIVFVTTGTALLACTLSAAAAAPSLALMSTPAAATAGDNRARAIVQKEATRLRSEWKASRIAITVLTRNGTVLATHDDAPGAPILPASTIKPLVTALALDERVISRTQRFDCGDGVRHYGHRSLRDANPYGSLAVGEILAVSSNVGMSRIFDALGGERLKAGLQRFGFRAPVHDSGSLEGALAAIGQREISTTPHALASAYAVFANGGVVSARAGSRRVLRESTARDVLSLLEHAVSSARATGSAARIAGVPVAGKTGTGDVGTEEQPRIFASFVGVVPADRPQFVIYVGVESANSRASGGTVAAPSFARLATALLGRK